MTDLIPGLSVGIIQTIIGHPLDTVKIWIQNNNNLKKQKINIKTLYAGLTYPLISSIIVNSIMFYSFDYFKNKNYNNVMSGCFSGFLISFILNPLDIYKIKYQQNILNNNIYYCKGLHITILRESIACSIYFSSYYYLKDNNIKTYYAGGISGLLSWLFTYPIDTIKTRIQSNICNNILDGYKIGNLWNGFQYCALRAIIVNAVGFETYEYIKKYI
jgi:solute carrier family 25 carnitine/acylcarnitine transporter 20/29